MKEIPSKNVMDQMIGQRAGDYSGYRIIGPLQVNSIGNFSFSAKNSEFSESVEFCAGEHSHTVLNLDNAVFEGAVKMEFAGSAIVYLNNTTIGKGLTIISKDSVRVELNRATLKGGVEIKAKHIIALEIRSTDVVAPTRDDYFSVKECVISNLVATEAKLMNACFNNCTFKTKAKFDKTHLMYSSAPLTGNFFDVVFEDDAYFNGAQFQFGCFFNGARFNGLAMFIGVNSSVSTIGDFSGGTFQKRSFFDNATFSKLVFNDCEFVDVGSFKYLNVVELKVSKAIFLKGADFLNSNIHKGDRETFRIIKNEFQRINNSVEALHYRAKEMVAYEAELSFKSRPSEWFLLWLNRISNGYGLSWTRGVLFTVIVAAVFFSIYLLTLERLPFTWGVKSLPSFVAAADVTLGYFLRFFTITHDYDFMQQFKPNGVSYFVDFVSKIFIGYGIYQTVQAFRKHGRT